MKPSSGFLGRFSGRILRGNKKKEVVYEHKPGTKTALSNNMEENTNFIKNILKDCHDVEYRDFNIGGPNGKRMFLFYIEGMIDKHLLDEFVLLPLMTGSGKDKPDCNEMKNKLYDIIGNSAMPVSTLKEVEFIEDALFDVLSGDSALIMDGYKKAIVIDAKSLPSRTVSEPTSETVIRGSRDGFTEIISTNTALIRKRIRDIRFKVKKRRIGVRSGTDIAVMYIEDIADKRVVDEVERKLDNINIDSVLGSGYIQPFLEDRPFSLFTQVQTTERPDVIVSAIYEGRVGILVDNSPNALIVPVTLTALFQSAEDYYERSVVSTFVRWLRIIAGLLSLLTPPLYIAITSFHSELLPEDLLMSIAATREGVPFPSFVEATIMEITLQLLREAGVRLPRPIGSTIGIVGGLVIGQAAVAAGIVSPIMIIVVSLTAIASFAVPSYDLASSFGIIRILFMVLANIYGLYGVVLGGIAMLIHMVNIKSFGTPFLAPISPFKIKDMKDSLFLRLPWNYLKERPEHLDPNDLSRQGGGKK